MISNFLKKAILKSARAVMSRYWAHESNKMPQTRLQTKHLQNAQLLPSRIELLKLLPKDGIVAEIGVDQGGFSEKILQHNQPKLLYLVDFWGSRRYNSSKKEGVFAKFEQEIENETIKIELGLSTEVVNRFEDNYFDWIYIDTDHSYDLTKEELKIYESKVKKQGVIAGHDYSPTNNAGTSRYGVIEAVHEFCKAHDWEIIYLSTELDINPSFAIRRIGAKS